MAPPHGLAARGRSPHSVGCAVVSGSSIHRDSLTRDVAGRIDDEAFRVPGHPRSDVTRKRDSESGAADPGRLRLPCPRDVRGILDTPDASASAATVRGGSPDATVGDVDPTACVVACPPHPQHGGSRSDPRLRAVADALVERGVACLRIDYGPWDEGRGERRDAVCALDWASERYDSVGLFGYSFGGAVALRAGADRAEAEAGGPDVAGPDTVVVLAPARTLPDGSDAVGAVGELLAPALVVCGERDEAVDWKPVVEAARAGGHTVENLAADHHFVGQHQRIAAVVAPFLAGHLVDETP